ncbi:Death-inducer obliterator 1 [Phytophthora citrophthora]|uniref:Death-inducer obliterator 1 n=1 Tax=Phytophthora citrophthora TaxID=4793 RepID=A0AAD9GZE6_9STRA|nr:Death-inducer obliterator 1 [Phytophthora citrophthora]
MSRRSAAYEHTAGERSPRERSSSVSSGTGSSTAAPAASPQFVALHSRVGKRYQAIIPELLTSQGNEAELLYKKQALEQPRPRYYPDKAQGLGLELDKYLKLARSLRDGATFDTQEQVETLALQHLHRFNYNTTDAACSLYARHSIELPRAAGVNLTATKSTAAEEAKKWLLAFYRCIRQTEIDGKVLEEMWKLYEKAQTSADTIPATEAGVLVRLVTRIVTWRDRCKEVSKQKVDRAQLLQLLHGAEDMQVVLPEKDVVIERLHAFDTALTQLKEALEHSSKRHQSKKVELKELNALFDAVMAPQLIFPEEARFRETVDEATLLKATIDKMLGEDKVSLPVMRDVLAKIELVPVNFEQEVEQFQNKMLNAQSWLAKARKCMPNRRATRRGGVGDTKKMDLEAIRALVDDAPCENSTEMFEMQDLLACADVWAVKVKEAIDGGSDVTMEHLKELLDEAKDIPVVMDEQKFLEAEISAREWCTTAASKLASRKSIEEMEDLISQAITIRERIHPKKQSRWKPQVERDINAALDQSRKWINELRDNLGGAAFDKLFASLPSYVSSSHSSRSASSSLSADRANKKSTDAISKLIEKSQSLTIDMSSYTTPLNDLLLKGVEAQAEASAILMSIGCLSGIIASESVNDQDEDNSMDVDAMPRELGDLAQASALLEKIDAFPFTFEEGLSLASIVESEKEWAARVRECIPPRQSRKKRLANDVFTTEQLQNLLNESKKLRFHFRDELRILLKELHDLTAWSAKTNEVINGEVSESVANVVGRLQSFDLMVYGKLQTAKKKLHIGDVTPSVAAAESSVSTDPDMSPATSTNALPTVSAPTQICLQQPPQMPHLQIKKEDKSDPCAMEVDAEGASDSMIPTTTNDQAGVKPEVAVHNENLTSAGSGERVELTLDTKPPTVNGDTSVSVVDLRADSIMTHVRIESGCMQKSATKQEDDDGGDSKTSWMAKNGKDLFDPVLAMAEESSDAVNSLELKEAEARQTVEELVLAGEEGDITENITDECVRVLDGWKQQLLQVQKDSDVLSVEAPEQKVVTLIISLLEWLQGSRSLFYDEILPLQDLVAKGDKIAEDLEQIKLQDLIKPETLDTLERMLWPLPYLKSHEKVVLQWTERVHKCIADKHARVSELQALLDNGSGLLLEQGTFKIVMDEAKKARIWLSKLKKRLRALMTKGLGRMSINAARSLVEEGEDIAIGMPVFDFLKEQLEIASDWETRVLASGIETGQARVANLLALLNEYECARLVIDLDMHRDVLKTATERYCICRQPFDGLMIGCDYCDDWFHDGCIGMSKEKAEKVEHYTCPSCTILLELAAMLEHAKVAGQQSNLWDMQEYAKAFEKHQASALRKVKREEKTVERTEMLLFSCNNQMNQLRARIDDIERAKACLSVNPGAGKSTTPQQVLPKPSTTQTSSPSEATRVTALKPTASTPVSASTVDTKSLLLAAAAASTTVVTSTSSAATQSSAVASTLATLNVATLNRQQYPSILIPPMRAVSSTAKTAPKVETVSTGSSVANSADSANRARISTDQPNAASLVKPSAPASSGSAVTASNSTQQATSTATPTSSSAPIVTATKVATTTSVGAQPVPAPLLNPMAATLMGSTERLAALVVAGGVEQQLAKMKNEHVEASKQVLELQSSLRLSRDRLANAQRALRGLSDVFHARHRMLPYAQAWAQRAVALLNDTKALSRGNMDFSTFLAPEYATALAEMAQPSTDATTSPTASPEAMGIDKLFPGADMYARLLRTVPWSQVVVSLLQERPSRGEISDAIAYATEYGLWEDKKIVSPLRSLIGRVDAWVSRAHKCMTKTTNKMQQLSRLKVLMNEYSKLPLTFAKAAEPLDLYVKVLTGASAKSKMKGDDEALTPEAAEATANKALDEAMIGISPAAASAANASSSSAAKKQAPRKRKPYTRKEKVPARTTKKMKKQHGAASTAGSVSLSTKLAAKAEPMPKAST